MRLSLAIALLFVATACGGPPSSASLHNVVPRARLAAPLYAPVGEAVVFDAGDSFDPDGAVLDYTFSFGDGSRQVTSSLPEVAHAFEQPGAYEVAVIVRDDGGQLGRATQLVVVRTDPPLCDASSECSLGAECRLSRCYATGSGPGSPVADCLADGDCGGGFSCRAGLCLTTGMPAP
jgi:hypothetical protein